MFRFFRKVSKIVAAMAAGLPLFRPASIERELEQTLRMVRSCHQKGSAFAYFCGVGTPLSEDGPFGYAPRDHHASSASMNDFSF